MCRGWRRRIGDWKLCDDSSRAWIARCQVGTQLGTLVLPDTESGFCSSMIGYSGSRASMIGYSVFSSSFVFAIIVLVTTSCDESSAALIACYGFVL